MILDKVIERINVNIDEGRLTSSIEDSKESYNEEEEGSNQKDVKKIKVEEQSDKDEKQLTEDEEQKDQLTHKNWYQKNHPSNQIIVDKDARIGTKRRQSERNEQVHFSLLSTTEPGTLQNQVQMNNGLKLWKKN